MKLVTFASFKGGCGKTTALMAIASMLVYRGKKIAIFEADINKPLSEWKKSAEAHHAWDQSCEIYPADDMSTFENSYELAEGKFEYGLIDTQGGASEFNQNILVNSNLVIVPSALTDLDMKSTIDTMRYAAQMFKTENLEIPIALLWQRFPTARLTNGEQKVMDLLDPLTQFETKLHKRDAFTTIGSAGMLHLHYKNVTNDPKKRLQSRTLGVAVNEAESLTNDLIEVMEG